MGPAEYVNIPKMRRVVRPCLVGIPGLLAFALVSCGAPKITSQMLLPAKSHEAAQIKRVTVLPFSGTPDIRHDVETMLVNTRVQGQPYFTVVERAELDKITAQQAISLSGAVDETTAAKVGKLVGAEGVIMGVVKAGVEKRPYDEKRSKCVAYDQKKKCTSQQEYTVKCVKSDAYFSFTPKIVSVATGHILASEVLDGRTGQERCEEDSAAGVQAVAGLVSALMGGDAKQANSGMRSDSEMLGDAKNQALRKFQQMMAPHYVSREFVMLEKDDTTPPAAAKEKIDQGVKWAKEGRLDRACEFWQEAYSLHSQGYAIHYDLGLCAEMVGKLPEALEYYEKADRLTGKPVKEINEALGRVRQTMAEQRRLEEQMQKQVNTPATTVGPQKVEPPPPQVVPVSSQQPSQRKGRSQR
jgi:curli biogenesis system outer membrane secretion channel CsgG